MSLLVLLQDVVQAAVDLAPLAKLGAALAAGIVTIGAGLGISRIASSALESSARQPEIADKAQTSMLISAAFVEGVSLFALVVCLLIGIA
ncbi:MAG: ATP synthase F0 subunit C [Bacteroidales bacterium]|nr:ATP synthase F0 subunit C [Bacteroidales bacterium]MBO5847687.1 ATP synthase F0 subunit C [Bacteroidales bacterium]